MPLSKPDVSTPRSPCGLPNPTSSNSFWHSEPSPLLVGHRSTRNLPSTADIVVIGSGMTGTSIAHHLVSTSTTPLKVVMLEAREACWGATGRNGGHCQPLLFTHPTDPSIGHFELANFHALQSLIKEKDIDCEFVQQPGVQALYDDQYFIRAQSALDIVKSNDADLAARMKLVTDPAELAELRVPTAKGAIVTNIAARMWPYKFVSRILEDLLASPTPSGTTFNLQTLTPVERLEAASGSKEVLVHTSRGPITAKKVILATNAYTSHLLPSFADLIVPVRGQMSALRPFSSISTPENRLHTSLGFAGAGVDDYLIQRPTERGAHLMFGGGRQAGGRTVGTTDDSFVDPETATYLRSKLSTTFQLPESGQQMEAIGMWTGIMGFSRDEKPWVGEVEGWDGGVYVAAGFSGHGMPNTWLSGKAVAGMVLGSMEGKEVKMEIPAAYLLSAERVKTTMQKWEDVEVRDWEEKVGGRVVL